MVLYSCINCNFSSNKSTNYNRHLTTKKHLKYLKLSTTIEVSNPTNNITPTHTIEKHNLNYIFNTTHEGNLHNVSFEYPEVSNSIQQDVVNKFMCSRCKSVFSHKNNYYRHVKHRCPTKISNGICSQNEYKKLMTELLNSKDKLVEEKDKRLQEKNEQIIYLKNNTILKNVTNNTFNTNNTLNNTNYVLNCINYSDADSMDFIKDKFKLTKDEFVRASLTNGYKGALMEKAENIIIKPYFDIESKRPIQTVDISRKKALYKDDINNIWTFNPKTTLEQCFKTFHNSAVQHQDDTIKDNFDSLIFSNDDSLYKQTYFIPTEIKEKEAIYREIINHIYHKTKIKRNIGDLSYTDFENDNITEQESIQEDTSFNTEIFDCGKRYLYNKNTNIVCDPNDNYKCIGIRDYNTILNNYYINYNE